MDMFIEPTKVISPYTGNAVFPKITKFTQDGKTYEQAVYNDPITGHFVKKGIVSIRDAQTGALIQDYTTGGANSIQSVSYRQ